MENEFRVHDLRIVRKIDDCPDLSYLESEVKNGVVDSCQYSQKDYDENPRQVEEWIEQDMDRLNSCGEDWLMIGIYAEVDICYPTENGHSRVETFTSSGLWGIESDSDEEYLLDIEREQQDDLEKHIGTFGIHIENFNLMRPLKYGDGFNWS